MYNLIFSSSKNRALSKGGLAQLVERLLCKQNVNGSNPLTSTILFKIRLELRVSAQKQASLKNQLGL